MAHKRLSVEQIQQMKQMVQKGTSPEDLANHFQIAISSVHNYKKRFKTEGVKFPVVRGKRPTGSIDDTKLNNNNYNTIGQFKNDITDGYKFIVNGVSVEISAQAKKVSIGKDSMEINF
jgi:UDP:flavonoid glycosyltransferase YjiC (YdhE family)